MAYRLAIGAIAAIAICIASAHAQDASKADASKYNPSRYPDWSGHMLRIGSGGARYDHYKPPGLRHEAPLTPEHQAILQAGPNDQHQSRPGRNPDRFCLPR